MPTSLPTSSLTSLPTSNVTSLPTSNVTSLPTSNVTSLPTSSLTSLPTSERTVAIVTLGCARNEVDSDQLGGLLGRDGYRLVDEPQGADVVLVNTCTFITPATEESVETVLSACDLKQDGTQAVVVVGCMAERYKDELADSLPEADAVVGFAAYPRLPAIVDDLLAGRPVARWQGTSTASPARTSLPMLGGHAVVSPRALPQDELDRIPATGPRDALRGSAAAGRPWAYLKIASGCDRACTFCAIPSWRGGFRSRPADELVREAAWLAERGARELVLVSENTTSWGKDLDGVGRVRQPELLERLSEVPGVERLRLVYLQPDEVRRPLLEAMAGLPKVASYFDLSLQHVSASVLERMARSGSPDRFRRLVAEIRELDPGAVFRSNFIVGFPGETDEDVEALASFLEDARLDWVGMFTFSPQEGTRAPHLSDAVPADVAEARLRELSDIQEVVADEAARAFVGRRLDVTVEAVEDGALGRSYREAPDTDGEIRLVTSDGVPVELPIGRTVTATVVEAVGVDLVAVPDGPERLRG